MAKKIVDIADLRPDARNANKGTQRGRGMVEASLREVGAGRSIVTDKDGRVIAGNKTLEAAADIGLKLRVVETDGKELVVVQRNDLDLSDDTGQARKLAYYDNRASETGLAWDAEVLLADLQSGVDLSAMFQQDELDALLAGLVENEPEESTIEDDDNEDQIEDYPVADLLAPYPWFGGKRGIAGAIWARFGEVKNYVEPFFGSGAMLLSRPNVSGIETVNDLDGFVSNFWRAVGADPAAVAHYVDYPVNENDLLSRHLWLVQQRQSLTDRLHTDPDYFDAKIAGWWCWGCCNYIGTGWCDGNGPWKVDGETVTKGDAGRGVNRQIPHLGNAGQGDGAGGQCEAWSEHLSAMMQRLSDRLRRVRVCCGDWGRVVTPSVTERHGLTGVFLDPPYAEGAMEYSAGGNQDASLSNEVRAWCIENGDNPNLRIAYCGYEPLTMPKPWTALRWTARKGYQNTENAANSAREIVWFSPHCIKPNASLT